MSKTQIVHQANLNFQTTRTYLNALQKRGYLCVEETGKYKTTREGICVLEKLKELEHLLST